MVRSEPVRVGDQCGCSRTRWTKIIKKNNKVDWDRIKGL